MSTKLKSIVAAVMVVLCAAPLASAAPGKAKAKSAVAAPSATTTTTTTSTCPAVTSSSAFAQWGDLAPYFLAPGGSMENATLWPGSGSFIADNDPFRLSGAGVQSLRLLNGQAATSPWVCQGSTYPTMRFMVRNVGSASAKLNVIMYRSGIPIGVNIATISATSAWAPSPIVTLPTGLLPDGVTIPKIELAFVATGTGADFRIDDVFIDPRSRG